MKVMLFEHTDSIELLRPIGNEWKANCNEKDFPLPISVDVFLNTMQQLAFRNDGDVLVLVNGSEVVGFIGLLYKNNHVGSGKIMNECCFYVSTKARIGGIKLIQHAERIGKSKGCDFSTLNASLIAGNAERASKFYSHCGYIPFESSHIKVL